MGLDNPVHILIVLVVVLALFGVKRLPEMGRSLGSGLREFKAAVTGAERGTLPAPPSPSGNQPDRAKS